MIPVKIKGHPYIISTDEAGGASGPRVELAGDCKAAATYSRRVPATESCMSKAKPPAPDETCAGSIVTRTG